VDKILYVVGNSDISLYLTAVIFVTFL